MHEGFSKSEQHISSYFKENYWCGLRYFQTELSTFPCNLMSQNLPLILSLLSLFMPSSLASHICQSVLMFPNIFVDIRKDGPKQIEACGTGGSCSWLWNYKRYVSTEFWVSSESTKQAGWKYDMTVDLTNSMFIFVFMQPSVLYTRFSTGREKDAQLCIYVGDEKVVDLWGSPSQDYTADTLTTVFSRHHHLWQISPFISHFVSCSFQISAQRVWQPLPWQPSMTKAWWTMRQGEELGLS